MQSLPATLPTNYVLVLRRRFLVGFLAPSPIVREAAGSHASHEEAITGATACTDPNNWRQNMPELAAPAAAAKSRVNVVISLLNK